MLFMRILLLNAEFIEGLMAWFRALLERAS